MSRIAESIRNKLMMAGLAVASAVMFAADAGSTRAKIPTSGVEHIPAGNLFVPDVSLQTQDGRQVSFYRDLVKGKVVAIDFVFTTCHSICPRRVRTFSQVQDLVGNRLAKDVFLISVSVDPDNDTPSRLKSWAAGFGARPGWTLVT